jgi:hypothetical protein
MNINRRVEVLEKKSPSTIDKVFIITQRGDESSEEAEARYCQENQLRLEELERAGLIIMMIHE